MKKINKLIYVFILVSLFACNDAIDIVQPGRLSADNAFQSISDLRLGLLGAYDGMDNTHQMNFSAVLTDEITTGVENGGQGNGLLNFNVNTSNFNATNIWLSNYTIIGSVNKVLAAAQNIDRNDDPDEYDNILGQLYALRAYAHFQILTYFSEDYTSDSALAGVLVDFVTDDIFTGLPRNTNGEFYALINSDLNTAASLINTDEGITFMGQDFIIALRARIAAYRGNYAQADSFAAQLLLIYPIADQAQYFSMYDDTDFTEVIFSMERAVNDNYDGQGISGGGWAGSLFAFIDPSANGGPFMEITRSTFNLLDGTDDVRFPRAINLAESTIDPNYDGNDNYLFEDILIIWKFPGSNSQPLMNDLKIFRSAEMLMIRAEAAADAGNLSGAAAFVKQLRDARYGSAQTLPVYANETEAFGDILDERRLEFLFEGHRWVDLKRLGTRGNRSIDRDTWECSFFSGCTLPASDFRFTMPIPQVELDGNTNIRSQQNPGY